MIYQMVTLHNEFVYDLILQYVYTQIQRLFQFAFFSIFQKSLIGKTIHASYTDKEVIQI